MREEAGEERGEIVGDVPTEDAGDNDWRRRFGLEKDGRSDCNFGVTSSLGRTGCSLSFDGDINKTRAFRLFVCNDANCG